MIPNLVITALHTMDHMHSKVWGYIVYPFPNSNGRTVEVLQWISNVMIITPDSKVHVANMGSTWALSAPGGSHFGPMNLAIRDFPMLGRLVLTNVITSSRIAPLAVGESHDCPSATQVDVD